MSWSDPPDFVPEEDGTVLIDGGDQATDCPSLALGFEEGYGLGPNNPERARAVLEQCEEAGFLDSSGGGTPSASPSASASASGSASP